MRTTVSIDDDVYEAARDLARASGKRLGEVLSELVRRALKAESKAVIRKDGLPAFKVSAEAQVIPSSRAAEILSEEP